jgi:hypothetical protein
MSFPAFLQSHFLSFVILTRHTFSRVSLMQRSSKYSSRDTYPRRLCITGSTLLLLIGLGSQPEFLARLYDWLSVAWHLLL